MAMPMPEAMDRIALIPKHQKMHWALILANVFFGVGAVVGALGLPATHPLVFALVRELGAGLILLSISMYFYRQPVGSTTDRRADDDHRSEPMMLPYALRAWTDQWKRFALLGLVVFGNQAGFIVGIKMAGPVTASVWQPSQPIFTAAICMALGWEPIQRKRLIGVLVAFLGCIAMVLLKASNPTVGEEPLTTVSKMTEHVNEIDSVDIQSNTNMAARYVIGNFLFFGNCLCTSLYVILSKRMLALYPALLVTAWSYNGASLIMFLTTIVVSVLPGADSFFCPECPQIQDPIQKLFHIPSGAVPALLYYIVFASVGSYGLMTWANQRATGTLVMSYTVLQPVTSFLLATLLLTFGAVASCHQRQSSSEVSLEETACLDYPSFGTACGMVGVFIGLALIISTEPHSDKVSHEDDPEKTPLTAAKRDELSSA
jgi:drug/metabolite transporter (DMT)-like permease